MRLVREMHEKRQRRPTTKAQVKEAEAILRAKKRALYDTAHALEAKRGVRAFSHCTSSARGAAVAVAPGAKGTARR